MIKDSTKIKFYSIGIIQRNGRSIFYEWQQQIVATLSILISANRMSLILKKNIEYIFYY